jgi:hypothetical protein
MRYRLTPRAEAGLRLFAVKCREHGILTEGHTPRPYGCADRDEEGSYE